MEMKTLAKIDDFDHRSLTGTVVVKVGAFGSGEPALLLETPEGTRLTICSVNIVEGDATKNLPPHQTYLKSWSEHEGVPEALEAVGVVELTGETLPCGDHGALAFLANVLVLRDGEVPEAEPEADLDPDEMTDEDIAKLDDFGDLDDPDEVAGGDFDPDDDGHNGEKD
jgi:hypothetical protein